MARIVSTVLVVALLTGTAAAFALTEGLKLQPSPIRGVQVAKVFSPICACETETASIRIRLRRAEVVDMTILDERKNEVSTVVHREPYSAGWAEFAFTGRDDDGAVLPEGVYRARVHLGRERRTIELPNDIRIDVTPPVVEAWDVRPRVFSPDGDGRADRVVVRYRVDEPARGMLFVDGERRGLTKFARTEDVLPWYGKVDGRALDPGTYAFTFAARDPAGNVSERSQPVPVRIRYVTLGRNRIEVRANATFAVRVSSDAVRVRWRLGRRSGESAPGTLRLRAPQRPGRHTLTVTANGRGASAAVFVRERRP